MSLLACQYCQHKRAAIENEHLLAIALMGMAIDPTPQNSSSKRAINSAAMEGSARFVVVRLLRHGGIAAAEFSENCGRRFASVVDPINA